MAPSRLTYGLCSAKNSRKQRKEDKIISFQMICTVQYTLMCLLNRGEKNLINITPVMCSTEYFIVEHNC